MEWLLLLIHKRMNVEDLIKWFSTGRCETRSSIGTDSPQTAMLRMRMMVNISRTNNENDDYGGSDDDDDDENDDDGGEKVLSKGGLWQHRRSKELRLSSTLVATAPPTH